MRADPHDNTTAPAAPSIDPLRALLRRHAAEVLAAAAGLPAPSRPLTLTAGDEALSCTILVTPAQTKEGRPLTACERDILATLEQAPGPQSTSRILTAMNNRGLLHGASTIGRALTRLVKLGVLKSSRRAPRGYSIPGKPFLLPPGGF